MRKISQRQKHWLQYHAVRSARRRLLFEWRKKETRRKELLLGRTAARRAVSHKGDHTLLSVPSIFSLHANYQEVARFFSMFRNTANQRKRRLTVDFTTMTSLSPAASLVLASEVDRWRRIKNVKLRVIDVEKWHPQVRSWLEQLGFFELLDVTYKPFADIISSTSVRFIRFCSGNQADGNLARQLRRGLEDIAGPIATSQYLYQGITEAMNNAIQHAYPDGTKFRYPFLKGEWWMCGSFDPVKGRFKVIFFDQGIGIPATLPRSSHWEKARGLILGWGKGSDDARLIEAAIEVGRSSTRLTGRGYGLDEIRQFIDRNDDGRLRILSGRGEYIYEKGGRVHRMIHPSAVGGTLIEWEVTPGTAVEAAA